jgi:hypothetical protein
MKKVTTSALLALLVGWPPCAGARPHPHPPTPVPREGSFDTNPVISADGRTVAWFHRKGWDTRLLVARAPFRAPPRAVVLKLHPHAGVWPVLSGDGEHLFWARGGRVQHARLPARGPLVARTLDLKAGPFGLCASRDGTRLAMLVDGPPARGRSPGWRAVFTAALSGGSWRQEGPLTPTRHGADVYKLTMSAAGNRLVFIRDHRPFEAARRAGTWKVRRIRGMKPGHEVLGAALSARGDTLLAQVRRPAGRRRVTELRVLRRVGGRWCLEQPAPRGKDELVFRPALAPDGGAISWVHRRYSGSKVSWTELRAARHRGGRWLPPVVLLRTSGYVQLLGAALGGHGSLVYSLSTGRDRFEVFYRRDLRPETKALKLGGGLP